jgi:hypothetical protein
MSFLEDIISLGFEMDTSVLLTENNKQFIISRDSCSYMDFYYTVRYNRIPSRAYITYNVSKFLDVLKWLKGKGFKLLISNPTFTRTSNTSYIFTNDSGVIVEIGNSGNMSGNMSGGYDEEVVPTYNTSKSSSITAYFDVSSEYKLVNELKDTFLHIEELDSKGKILLFEKNEFNEMVLTPYPVKGYDLDINVNYNDDFAQVHDRLQKWIPDFKSQNNKLVLFNGQPGTGKTNYLKYLLNNTPDVKKIYIPPYFVQSISDPAFFPIIRREKESLLIIEDAEKILVNREEQADNSTISILLNLCDGIMADVLNFKIIATFNTDVSKIDDALKRKGRMFMHYEFNKLVNRKAANLYEKVHGVELDNDHDMTLADIYNDENQFGKKKVERKIGFGS